MQKSGRESFIWEEILKANQQLERSSVHHNTLVWIVCEIFARTDASISEDMHFLGQMQMVGAVERYEEMWVITFTNKWCVQE